MVASCHVGIKKIQDGGQLPCEKLKKIYLKNVGTDFSRILM